MVADHCCHSNLTRALIEKGIPGAEAGAFSYR